MRGEENMRKQNKPKVINYWIRYFVYAIISTLFAIFGTTNSLVVVCFLLLFIEINYHVHSMKEESNEK